MVETPEHGPSTGTCHYLAARRSFEATAITHGKRLIIRVGSRRAPALAMKNKPTEERCTMLADRLRAAAGYNNTHDEVML